jgi:bZIP-type transcription factor MBZ1
MYPGMHSQLAAQAKAQQAQKQSIAGQQPRQMPQGQRPLSQNSKSQPPKDPHVEESISRLLNQMRQSSVASVDDDASTPTANLPHLARLKKDEDEMDEDERLLASEEGKKLSSKERRQLRNKVSARAFRSRRKGKEFFCKRHIISVLTWFRIYWPARGRSCHQDPGSQ